MKKIPILEKEPKSEPDVVHWGSLCKRYQMSTREIVDIDPSTRWPIPSTHLLIGRPLEISQEWMQAMIWRVYLSKFFPSRWLLLVSRSSLPIQWGNVTLSCYGPPRPTQPSSRLCLRYASLDYMIGIATIAPYSRLITIDYSESKHCVPYSITKCRWVSIEAAKMLYTVYFSNNPVVIWTFLTTKIPCSCRVVMNVTQSLTVVASIPTTTRQTIVGWIASVNACTSDNQCTQHTDIYKL